jgi:hypothetical protein
LKNLLLIFSVVAAILGAFIWMFLAPEEDDFLDEVQITTTDSEVDRVPRRASGSAREIEPEPRVVRRAKVNLDQPIVFANTTGLDDSNSTIVTVVDNLTNESLAGAVVAVVEKDAQAGFVQERLIRSDFLGFFRTFGSHYQTSEDGTVRIPDRLTGCIIAAFTDNLFVRQTQDAPLPLAFELRASPILKIKARVLDGSGQPVVDASVRLGLFSSSNRGRTGERYIGIQTARTGEDGIALLRGIGGELYSAQRGLSNAKGFVDIDGLFIPRVKEFVDLENPPKGLIDLRLPELGSIDLRILMTDGTPLRKLGRVEIVGYDRSNAPGFANSHNQVLYLGHIEDGRLLIPHVTCGKKFRIIVWADVLGDVTLSDVKSGPTKPGETKEITLRIPMKIPALRGRVLDSAQVPLVNQKIEVVVRGRFSWNFMMRGLLRTDEKGHFELPMGFGLYPEKRCSKRTLTIRDLDTNATTPAMVQVALTLDPITNDLELGDLVLKDADCLASGRVVNANGLPVYRAKIAVNLMNYEQAVRNENKIEAVFPPRVGRDGEFRIFGTSTTEELRITISADDYLTQSIDVKKGQENVEVELIEPARIRGRLVLANGADAKDLFCTLINVQSDDKKKLNLKADGAFSQSEISAGTYRLFVTGHKSQDEALLEETITLAPGQNYDFGDLRIEFSGARLDLTLIQPKRVPRGLLVVVRDPASDKEITRFVMGYKQETIYVPVKICDLLLTTAGYRQTTISGVSGGDVQLRLLPGIPVTFEFMNSEVVPKDHMIEFWVNPNLGTGPFWLKEIGPNHVVPFHSPGTYRMSATIAKVGKLSKRERFPVSPRRVEVLDSTSTQNFRLRLDPEDIKRALKKLAGR